MQISTRNATTKNAQEDTAKTSKIPLESLGKAIIATQTQQLQLAMVDVELLQQIDDARRETAYSAQQLQTQTEEAAR